MTGFTASSIPKFVTAIHRHPSGMFGVVGHVIGIYIQHFDDGSNGPFFTVRRLTDGIIFNVPATTLRVVEAPELGEWQRTGNLTEGGDDDVQD